MPYRRGHIGAVAVAFLSIAGAACSGDDGREPRRATTSTSTSPSTTAETPATAPPTAPPPTTAPPATSAPAGPSRVVRQGDASRQEIALTFDAGSDTGNAARILDTLASEGVAATFGITGSWARANPDLVRRIATDGHQILNHTDTHRSFTGVSTSTPPLSTNERQAQLAGADDAIRAVTDRSTRPWFRPPYGDIDDSVLADVGAGGYEYTVLWSVDSLGWTGLDPVAITARVVGGAAPGGIVLLHVGAQSRDADALPAILDALRDQGFSFTTVEGVLDSS